MHPSKVLAVFILAFGLSAMMASCSSKDLKESNSPEAAFKEAEEFEKDERFEDAITKFSEVKNKHPYSRFAVESELRIADIHYKREAFVESQVAYQLFKDFHPKHAKIDYVIFRLGMSYFNQLPSTVDRDLGPATKAIGAFDELAASYSQSAFVTEAKDKRKLAMQMLADKEAYIAHFYFIREKYDSAMRRYNGLLEKYPRLGHDEEALYRAGYSAFEIGDAKQGVDRMNTLKKNFPNSSYASKAQNLLEKYGNR